MSAPGPDATTGSAGTTSRALATALPIVGQSARENDHRASPAVREHVGVVVGRQQRVDRDRHDAGVQRAEKGDREVDAVVHRQQHAVFATQPEALQPGGAAPHALVELAIGQARRVVDVGELVAALRVDGEQLRGDVEALGQRLDGGERAATCDSWQSPIGFSRRVDVICCMSEHYSAVDARLQLGANPKGRPWTFPPRTVPTPTRRTRSWPPSASARAPCACVAG
jgi:hypothetical protein